MAVSAKIVAVAGLSLLFVPAAWADDSRPLPPGAPCEGTLCDWYHSTHDGNANASAPGGTTPAATSSGGLLNWFGKSNGPKNAQPAEEPSSTNNYMSMGGGGLISGSKERCTGTLCDTYYGSSPTAGSQAPAGQQQAAAAPAEPRVPYHHIVHESETRPKCSSPSADPWRCFR